MEIDYTYTYMLANAAELLIWSVFFWWRADLRREMLWMSMIGGIAGLIAEPIYTRDWWNPSTITGTTVGVEDFIFGFWIGGIAAVAYEVLFRKVLRPLRYRKVVSDSQLFIRLALWTFCGSSLFIAMFFGFAVHSFFASLIVMIPFLLLIWWRRHDLIFESVMSGLLIVVIGYLWFLVPEFLTPGWVQNQWQLENLMGVMFLNVPLEDMIWGFLAGALIGPLYEFLCAARLVRRAA